jgi:hypothetical protein
MNSRQHQAVPLSALSLDHLGAVDNFLLLHQQQALYLLVGN